MDIVSGRGRGAGPYMFPWIALTKYMTYPRGDEFSAQWATVMAFDR